VVAAKDCCCSFHGFLRPTMALKEHADRRCRHEPMGCFATRGQGVFEWQPGRAHKILQPFRLGPGTLGLLCQGRGSRRAARRAIRRPPRHRAARRAISSSAVRASLTRAAGRPAPRRPSKPPADAMSFRDQLWPKETTRDGRHRDRAAPLAIPLSEALGLARSRVAGRELAVSAAAFHERSRSPNMANASALLAWDVV
jgi:hypothetical protein